MHVKDQSGSADDPLKYVLFQTPSATYQGYRAYTLPVIVSTGTVTNIKININYKGPARSTQTWSWYLFNWVSNRWVKVGDNTGAVANAWKALQFNVTASPTDYINNLTREIRLRLVSNNASGNAKLDFESIQITHHTCADPLGCVAVRSGDPIHIAYILNIPTLESKNGALVGIDLSGGKILGHTVKFDGVERTDCNPALATTDSAKMRKDASILAVIGTTCSAEAMAIMPGLSSSGYTMVSPSNTNPSLTEPGNPNNHPGYFRVSWSDAEQGRKAAQYAYNSLGARKAATINDQGGYATALEDFFVDEFTALGGTISTRQIITPGQTDFSAVLDTIAADVPDIIYLPVFLPEGGYLIVQARATAGLETVPLMGSDAMLTPDTVTAAGADVEGFLVTSGNDVQQYRPSYAATFVPAYTAKFGVAPAETAFAPYGHDAFRIIRAAIMSVATLQADGSHLIGRKALRDALYATSNFNGVTGILTCSATGDCADAAIAVYEYHAGNPDPTRIWP
jgi:branched-chain amino acid transport system substrate-binding protein